jgi:uncharacterized membrane protein YhiD involved in acid resistance
VNVILQKLGLTGGSDLTIGLIFTALITSFILGYALTYVYRKTHTGFSYEASFNFTLVMITVITTVIMMVIGSNIALSLGLIGSLSIIRFRAVIKDSKDMAYLFWAIATGLSVGSANYLMAVFSGVFIAVVVVGLSRINFAKATHMDYIMVVQRDMTQHEEQGGKETSDILEQSKVKWNIRSSLVDQDNLFAETTYSIFFTKSSIAGLTELVDKVSNLESIKKVTMLSPETNLYA